MRPRRNELLAGLFFLGGVAGFVGLFVKVSGTAEEILSPQLVYFTRLHDAEGLASGGQVFYAGIPAGRVTFLHYYPGGVPSEVVREYDLRAPPGAPARPDGSLPAPSREEGPVLVVFQVDQGFRPDVGCWVQVQKPLFGGASLNVVPASLTADRRPVPEGSYVPGSQSTMYDLVEQLPAFKDRLESITGKTEAVLDNLTVMTQEESPLGHTLSNLQTVTENLVEFTDPLDEQFARLLSPQMTDDLTAAVASLRSISHRVDVVLAENLPEIAGNLESLTARVDTLLQENADPLASLIRNATETMAEFRTLPDRLGLVMDRASDLLEPERGQIPLAVQQLRGVLDRSEAAVTTLQNRLDEFQWSYLHYILFPGPEGEESLARLVDLSRELTRTQERIQQTLASERVQEPEMRAQLERQLQAIDEIQRVLFDSIRARAR